MLRRGGSAPRVRGMARSVECAIRPTRFSPARAGNGHRHDGEANTKAVQPRACGEWFVTNAAWGTFTGSAPRVRGMAWESYFNSGVPRFSPARAGNGIGGRWTNGECPVQPRACGEWWRGRQQGCPGYGSAPRVRGMVAQQHDGAIQFRFSPARAGNGRRGGCNNEPSTVQPRACGEWFVASFRGKSRPGSAPRVRGMGGAWWPLPNLWRFSPARAGNGPNGAGFASWVPVQPRACGEWARATKASCFMDGSAPRVRGMAPIIRALRGYRRFSPARAGNGSWRGHRLRRLPVQPRACGEWRQGT